MKNNIIGKNIKVLRTNHHITQKKLASFLCTNEKIVSNWETGRSDPDIKTLIKISKYFEVSVDFLLDLKEF